MSVRARQHGRQGRQRQETTKVTTTVQEPKRQNRNQNDKTGTETQFLELRLSFPQEYRPLFYTSLRNDILFVFLSSFAPTSYIRISGVAKSIFLRFSGSALKTTMGVISSMPVFHLGTRRLRFGASGSRLDVTSDATPGRHW